MYFIIKITRDSSNMVTNRKIIRKTDKIEYPRGGEYIAIDGDDSIKKRDAAVLVAIVDGREVLSIVEDPGLKADSDFEDDIVLRKRRMDFGKRMLAIIAIQNDAKSLSGADLDTQLNTYKEINILLLNGCVKRAKDKIKILVPDGTIITQGNIDQLVTEFDDNETGLGY